MANRSLVNYRIIQDKIYDIRGLQVMMDRDLAELYGVETKVLNQAVKRNIERFPRDFMFQLTDEEFENWRSQFVTSNSDKMGLRRPPYAFTEIGVSMLASVLKSKTAIEISITIIRTFVEMRKFIANNALVFQRLDSIEKKQLETDSKFEKVFKAIEAKEIKPANGIFFDGQIFDAYVFINDLIKQAKSSLVLIDNYIDETVLMMLSRRKKSCKAIIYTQKITGKLKLDLKKHNEQYPVIDLRKYNKSHDRFLILDEKDIYHIGASLKDLGKKWFAFSLIKIDAKELIKKLEDGVS